MVSKTPFLSLLLLFLCSSYSLVALPSPSRPSFHDGIQRRANDASTAALTWDKTSFSILGEKVVLNSVEFHPWRLPVPQLWRDPLQKLKSGGVNTVSIYTHWAMIMPSSDPASVSLDAPANRLADFLTVAKEVGLFVILRPGPYINAETTGGGMPGWVQNLGTQLRTNTTTFNDAWKPYVKAVVDAAAPFQVKASGESGGELDTSGGTLIAIQVENEFEDSTPMANYFDEIIAFYRANGITVPTTFNALSGTTDYANNTKLDIWGADDYPQNFDCARPTVWAPVKDYTFLQEKLRPTNPASIPEFQGGSYDAWGGSTYDQCAQLTNSSFVRVFDKSVFGDGVKFKSDYMGYGGTNWGNLAYGGLVYTSYDYGAGINEKRIIREKFRESTLIGSFFRSFPDFGEAGLVRQGKNEDVSDQSEDIFVSQLRNNRTSASWYFVRHSDSTASSVATFRLNIEGANGEKKTIPQSDSISLVGRDAIVIPVNTSIGSSNLTLAYSTSDVSFLGTIGDRDVVFLHGESGFKYEFAVSGNVSVTSSDESVKTSSNAGLVVNWTPQENAVQSIVLKNNDGGKQVLVQLADINYAHQLAFTPTSSPSTLDGILGRGDRVIVHGAYHVANATLSQDGATLNLAGHLNGTDASTLSVLAPETVKQVTFNGAQPSSTGETNAQGALQVTFGGAPNEVLSYEAPSLSSWKCQNSLPEIAADYKPDANWRSANLTNTTNAWFGNSTTPNVLFADAYGFHSGGAMIWQARFNASTASPNDLATSLSVKYIGGKFFGSSTFLNGKFVGATEVPTQTQSTSATFNLTQDQFVEGDNVFTVLMDSTGLEETGSVTNVDGFEYPLENTKQPRGIFSFDLLTANKEKLTNTTLEWSVTGNQGGESLLDKTRGPVNEGGLFAERQGWHLPGFDDSAWPTCDPTTEDGGVRGANVEFYRTSVALNIPTGFDVPLSIVYAGNASDATQSWRSLLFVNGWQYGKRFVQFGPQTNFPVPPGILDPRGDNTIAVALWSPDEKGATLPKLTLEKQGVFVGDVDYTVNNPSFAQVRGGGGQ